MHPRRSAARRGHGDERTGVTLVAFFYFAQSGSMLLESHSMDVESQLLRKIQRNREAEGTDAFAVLMREWDQDRPAPEDFKDVYDELRIARDRRYVETVKRSPEYIADRSRESKIPEYAIMEGVANHGWMGKEAVVSQAAEFDDIANGIDAVVALKDPKTGRWVHLGIDATTDPQKVEKKARAVMERLINFGKLSEIAYYEPAGKETGIARGRLELPRVIIQTDSKDARGLQEGFLENPASMRDHQFGRELRDACAEQLTEQKRHAVMELNAATSEDRKALFSHLIEEIDVVLRAVRAVRVEKKDATRVH